MHEPYDGRSTPDVPDRGIGVLTAVEYDGTLDKSSKWSLPNIGVAVPDV